MDPNIDDILPAEETETSAREFIEDLGSVGLGNADPRLKESIENFLALSYRQLYGKPSHFLLELLQNADDNDYPADSSPTLSITFNYLEKKILCQCNEVGFHRKHVRAICKLAGSTKTGSAESIGEKGIGFKSVFKAADVACIASGPYRFKFDKRREFGIVSPEWWDVPAELELDEYKTHIVLELSENEGLVNHLLYELYSFDASSLVFLQKLKHFEVRVFESRKRFTRTKTSNGDYLSITCRDGKDGSETHCLALRLFSTEVTDLRPRPEYPSFTKSTITLGFPVDENGTRAVEIYQPQVYGYLPIRYFGFKCILQANFALTANRGDIDSSVDWNNDLLRAIPRVFADAVEQLSQTVLRFSWPLYLSLDLTDFCRDTGGIIKSELLKRKILVVEDEEYGLVCPNDAVYVPEEFRYDDTIPLILNPTTGSRYLSHHYLQDPSLYLRLQLIGLETLDINGFLTDLRDYALEDTSQEARGTEGGLKPRTKSFRTENALWHCRLAAILNRYTYLSSIKELKIIPLSDGNWDSWTGTLEKGPIYFPSNMGKDISLPSGFGIRLVHPDILLSENKERYDLFTALGTKLFDAKEICGMIETAHRSEAPSFTVGVTSLTTVLISHALFLFRHRKKFSLSVDLWVGADGEGMNRASSTYLSKQLDLEVDGHIFPVLHPDYSKCVPANELEDWTAWLDVRAKVRTFPRLVDSSDDKFRLSDEMTVILGHWKWRSILRLFQEHWDNNHWADYANWLGLETMRLRSKSYRWKDSQKELRKQIGRLMVSCKGGGEARLSQTILPSGQLQNIYGTESLFILDIGEDDIDNWLFLQDLGVRLFPGLDEYLQCLECLKSSSDDLNPPAQSQVSLLYDRIIDSWNDETGTQHKIRKRFDDKQLVHIPTAISGRQRSFWAPASQCVWEPRRYLRLRTLHSVSRVYTRHQRLFLDILCIPNAAGIKDILTDVRTAINGRDVDLEYLYDVFREIGDYVDSTIKETVSDAQLITSLTSELSFTKFVPILSESQGNDFDDIFYAIDQSREWFIADRPYLFEAFSGCLPILAFRPESLSEIESCLQFLREVDPRFHGQRLSAVARPVPTNLDASTNQLVVEFESKIRRKWRYLDCLIPESSRYRSMLSAANIQLRAVTTNLIHVRWRLQSGQKMINSHETERRVVVAVDDVALTIYMPLRDLSSAVPPLDLTYELVAVFNIPEARSALVGYILAQINNADSSSIDDAFKAAHLDLPQAEAAVISHDWDIAVRNGIKQEGPIPDGIPVQRLEEQEREIDEKANTGQNEAPFGAADQHSSSGEGTAIVLDGLREAHALSEVSEPLSKTSANLEEAPANPQELTVTPEMSSAPPVQKDHGPNAPPAEAQTSSEEDLLSQDPKTTTEKLLDFSGRPETHGERPRVSLEDLRAQEGEADLHLEEEGTTDSTTRSEIEMIPDHDRGNTVAGGVPSYDVPDAMTKGQNWPPESQGDTPGPGLLSDIESEKSSADSLSPDLGNYQAYSTTTTPYDDFHRLTGMGRERNRFIPVPLLDTSSDESDVDADVLKDSEVKHATSASTNASSDTPGGIMSQYLPDVTTGQDVEGQHRSNPMPTPGFLSSVHPAPGNRLYDDISGPAQLLLPNTLSTRDTALPRKPQHIGRQPSSNPGKEPRLRVRTRPQPTNRPVTQPIQVGSAARLLNTPYYGPSNRRLEEQFKMSRRLQRTGLFRLAGPTSIVYVSRPEDLPDLDNTTTDSQVLTTLHSRLQVFKDDNRSVFALIPTLTSDNDTELSFQGQAWVSQMLSSHLGAAYNIEVDWWDPMRTRLNLATTVSPIDKGDPPFVLEGDTLQFTRFMAARYPPARRWLQDPPITTYYIDVQTTAGSLTSWFGISLERMEKMRECSILGDTDPLDADPEGRFAIPTKVFVLVRLSDTQSQSQNVVPTATFLVDPWRYYTSGLMDLEPSHEGFRMRVNQKIYEIPSSRRQTFEMTTPRKITQGITSRREYTWESLGTQRRIRLLEIHPGKEAAPLRGSLRSYALESKSYIAISYAWGSSLKQFSLETPEGTIMLTTSLYLGLLQLREPDKPVFVWSDAICIKQTPDENGGNEEKVSQIQLLHEIFRGAKTVYAWLGVEEHGSAQVMDTFRNWGKILLSRDEEIKLEIAQVEDPIWVSISKLLRRRWFQRIWIVQEVVLASQLVVVCGKRQLSWDVFYAAAELCLNLPVIKKDITIADSDTAKNINDLGKLRRRFHTKQGFRDKQDMFALLNRCYQKNATVPRDRIFALLSMATDKKEFMPDYTSEDSEVILKFASVFVTKGYALELLYRSRPRIRAQKPSLKKLPSWVPDLTGNYYPKTLSSWRGDYSAGVSKNSEVGTGGKMNLAVIGRVSGSSLLLPGYIVDTIDGKGIKPSVFDDVLLYLQEVFDTINDLQGGSGVLAENTQPKPEEHRNQTEEEEWTNEIKKRIEAVKWKTAIGDATRLVVGPSHKPLAKDRRPARKEPESLHGKEVDARTAYGALAEYLSKRRPETSWKEQSRIFKAAMKQETLHGDRELWELLLPYLNAAIEFAEMFSPEPAVVCYTKDRRVGIIPFNSEPEDVVAVFKGSKIPFLLRQSKTAGASSYELVGECYVHGVMRGEVLASQDVVWEDIRLV